VLRVHKKRKLIQIAKKEKKDKLKTESWGIKIRLSLNWLNLRSKVSGLIRAGGVMHPHHKCA